MQLDRQNRGLTPSHPMQKHPQIKRFVQQTLGCSCPEEVFETIAYEPKDDGIRDMKITVGDRLLIYIIRADKTNAIRARIDAALQQGMGERNEKGYNRFRLVLVTSRREALAGDAEAAFSDSRYADARTHLHLVGPADLEGL
jgi:hypothetical protein